MRTKITAALLTLIGLSGSFVAGYATHTSNQPNCPTEDSCSIDYNHGQWHIEPTIP